MGWGVNHPNPLLQSSMTRKKRILMCAESHKVSSGFGRYTFEILSRLSKNPNYEIAELSCYSTTDQKFDVPWKVYPCAVSDSDPRSQQYKSNPINQFGQWRFEKIVLDFRPDIVFDIRDYWMFSYQEMSPIIPYVHWLIAPTIDSIPQKTEWLRTFENADMVLTHTDWAGNYLKSLGRKINVGPCVTDSVDTNEFAPLNYSKSFHKTQFGLDPDSIIIGSVMRNQKRKLIPALFKNLKRLIDLTGNNKIYLHLHTSYPEANGWDIPDLLQEYEVYNNVLFTYYAPEIDHVHVSTFQGVKTRCPKDLNQISIIPNVVKGISNKHLNNIYNLFDIYVQYAICEGLGIPQLEAASCGVPVMAVDYSGMDEITSKIDGVKIRYVLSKELETGADRAIPDDNHLIEEILKWINLSKKDKRSLSTKTRQLLIDNYSWDKTAAVYTTVFDSLEPKNLWDKPMEVNTADSVPEQVESNRKFIEYIVNNIIKEPRLLNTYFVQNLIRSLDETYSTNAGAVIPFTKKEAVKTLEVYLNNKIICEKLRSGELPPEDEDYLKLNK